MIIAAVLLFSLAPEDVAAFNASAVAQGTLGDVGADGIVDYVVLSSVVTGFFPPFLGPREERAVFEFDVGALAGVGAPGSVERAFLWLDVSAASLPAAPVLSVQVFGDPGDGVVDPGDFDAGAFIATLDDIVTEPFTGAVPVVDITDFVRASHPARFLTFVLRVDPATTPGSLQVFSPRLVVELTSIATDCGDGVGPCSCGDRVVSDTTLDASDPVLGTRCPCHGLLVASGVTLDIGGTIRSGGPDVCTDPRVGLTAGIKIEPGAADVTIRRGRIAGFEYGVAGSSVDGGLVTGLQVLDAVFEGVFVAGDSNTIDGNLVRRMVPLHRHPGQARTGIEVAGDENTVSLNRVEASGLHGISASGRDNRVYRNVVVRSVRGGGIAIAGTDATVDRNRAEDGDSHGVEVTGTGHELTANIARRNNRSGFFAFDTATGNGFRRNIADYNRRYGFEDLSADNAYEDNGCTGNGVGDSSPPGLCE
jgi:hypothetical protein